MSKNKLNKIGVLDYGFVRLLDQMGDDLSIVRSARISYNAEWRSSEDAGKDEKLIHYLYKNGHNTPFEAVTFTFEVKAPIFVIRQWHRHRTQSYNEVSARYTKLPEEFYVPKPEHIGKQAQHNKQTRELKEYDGQYTVDDHQLNSVATINQACRRAFQVYDELIRAEVPRELARLVLPMATYTHMFATMNLHNLFRFLSERLHPHAQWEIRQYAQALLNLIEPIVPVAVSAFKEELE